MKLCLLLIMYCTLTVPVFSQKAKYNEHISYAYFDKDWGEMPAMEGASYVRVFMGLDAIRAYYEVREYTISGTLLSSICSSSREFLAPQGPCTWYNNKRKPSKKGQNEKGGPAGQWSEFYYNGQMKEQYTFLQTEGQQVPGQFSFTIDNSWDSTGHAEVVDGNGLYQGRDDTTGAVLIKGMVKHGMKDSTWQGFDKNGQKEYEEEYMNGTFMKGIRFNAGGSQVVYDKLWEPPVYPGGQDAIAKFLFRNIKYPRSAQEKGSAGTVVVKFMVAIDGSMTHIVIDTGVEKSLNAEALRVVKLMPAWIPGKLRGRIEPVPFRLPIRFSIQ